MNNITDAVFLGTEMTGYLTYSYNPQRTHLTGVADAAPLPGRDKGFKPKPGAGAYLYDANGNMTFDPHKDITITYNFLNLPSQINKTGAGGGTISLTYDAAGRKWRKQVTGVTKDYCQGIEYKDGKVEAVYGQEGRLTAVYDQYGVTLTSFRAEYWLKDHLGNTRLAFADENHNGTIEVWDDPSTPENEAEIVQENHYYPFGMNHEGPWYATIGPRNGYQYNGKELNEELDLDWNDFGARWQDPATGRFISIDRFAEKYNFQSVYAFAANNPIKFVDINGDSIYIYSQKDKQAILYHKGNLYWAGTGKTYDGKAYNKKGNLTGFVKQASGALDNIRTGGAAGKELIDYFQNASFKDIRIEYGTSNGERSGLISWNPKERNSSIPNQDGSFGRDPFIGLAHEIGHSWDRWENGNANTNSTWYTAADGTNVTQSEKVATWWENRIRAENNVGLREFYSFTNSNGRMQGDAAGRLLIQGTRYSQHNNIFGQQRQIVVGPLGIILNTPYRY